MTVAVIQEMEHLAGGITHGGPLFLGTFPSTCYLRQHQIPAAHSIWTVTPDLVQVPPDKKGNKPWKTGVKLNINHTPFCNLCILARCGMDSSIFCIPSSTFFQTCHCQTLIHAHCYCCLCLQALTFLFRITQSKHTKYKDYPSGACYKQHKDLIKDKI